jgi:hypothetical protein
LTRFWQDVEQYRRVPVRINTALTWAAASSMDRLEHAAALGRDEASRLLLSKEV